MSPLVHSAPSPTNTATLFPRRFVSLLRCIRDSSELILEGELPAGEEGVTEGTLRCAGCSQQYEIHDGIARMMIAPQTEESGHEIALKDREYATMPDAFEPAATGWRSEFMDRIEIPPHLRALGPLQGRRLLELGCGDGRFTVVAAQEGADVLAVDFAVEGLRKLAANLARGEAPTRYRRTSRETKQDLRFRVGLVQADAGQLCVAPKSFDRALSATPLDSRDERMRMFGTVAEALNDEGLYVGGFEYDDLPRRLLGLPVARRYSPGGILIEHLDLRKLRRETSPYFFRTEMRLIRIHLPMIRFLPAGIGVPLALAAARIPGLREFAQIILVRATHPIRLPKDGERRRGSAIVRNFYVWYKRALNQEAVWDKGEKV